MCVPTGKKKFLVRKATQIGQQSVGNFWGMMEWKIKLYKPFSLKTSLKFT